MTFSLQDLEGIGPISEKKLNKAGINSPLDIIVRGVKEFSRVSGLTKEKALTHTKSCLDLIADDGLNIKIDNIDELEAMEENTLQFKVNVEELDEMLDGGFETQSIYEVYGEDGSGKTQLSLVLAMEVIAKGHGIIVIDCEGAMKTKRMKGIAEARDIEYDKTKIGFHRYLDEAILFEGIQNMIPEILEKEVKLIVIDGLVGVMRMAYRGRGELADRQIELKEILKYLRNMAALFNLCIVLTNQVTANPDPFGARLKPIGGYVLGHNVKYIIGITKGMKNNRIAKLVKSPCSPTGEFPFFLNEEGVSGYETLAKARKAKKMDAIVEHTGDLVDSTLLLKEAAESV
jgi:DNA repair protein RadA